MLGNKEEYLRIKENRNATLKKLSDDVIYRLAKEQEDEAGLYPDHFDPRFITHLVQKLEFADTLSKPFNKDENPCLANEEFETSPVQRFVASFLHPQTPYRGILLYHGVGVGKTCAAILTTEGYLEQFPYKKVIIIAPRNIQPGFFRTIFDSSRLVIGKEEEANRCGGCLQDLYLRLTNNLYTRDKAKIERDILKLIKKRYSFFGYLQFANFIRSITNKVTTTGNKKLDDEKISALLRREFNYHMIVIDEAHNLRDIDGVDKEEDNDTVEADVSESAAGKLLTPYLTRVLRYVEGIKLMLMTATPMFNNVREIVFLLNRFLINEKREQISDGDIFDGSGELKEGANVILGKYASAYISFMRGENPNSFPLRLKPVNHPLLTLEKAQGKFLYPSYQPTLITQKRDPSMAFVNNEVEYERLKGMVNLPFYISQLDGYNENIIANLLGQRSTGALNFTNLDALIQAGNVVFPGGEDGESNNESSSNSNVDTNEYVGAAGFDLNFNKSGGRYKATRDASWLLQENIAKYSPKVASIIGLIQKAKGVVFTYSRFVRTGALFLALALEANGYTSWSRDNSLLVDVGQLKQGRQCARCSQKERGHDSSHSFLPAKYVLLTGDQELSPNNAKSIDAARDLANKGGEQIKVIIGSQIAAEGLDLRFVREIHVMDPWFHLNKTEQIIGRGIRFCSHSAIQDEKLHNTTIFLHAVVFKSYKVETADLYSYRIAYKKALQIGKVSRVLKEYALDCNLRIPATVINTDSEQQVIDSQGNDRGMINLSDVPYSPLCDWLPSCDLTCKPSIDIGSLKNIDNGTYSQFTARFRESLIKKSIVELFTAQSSYSANGFEDLVEEVTGAPELAISMVLRSIVGNQSYVIRNGSQRGYISYRNGYYVFKPLIYKDRNLPAALRIADLPIKRDSYLPKEISVDAEPSLEQEVLNAEDKIGKVVPTVVQRAQLWTVLSNWIDLLGQGKLKITPKVESTIDNATDNNRELNKKYMERLTIIVYFFSLEGINNDLAKKTALEYVWDNFLNKSEQLRSLDKPDESLKSVAKNHILQSGSINARRFLNYDTGDIDYICGDGKPCSIAVSDSFKGVAEPIKSLKADNKSTGFFYGFMAAKRGSLVFKTQAPHPVGGVPDRGQECSYDSVPTEKKARLVSLGEFMKKKGLSNLELKEGVLTQASQMKNATCYCILLELILRYMDHIKVDNKRWFYRSIESKYTGHKFLTISSKKLASKKTTVKAVKGVPVRNVEVVDAPLEKKAPVKKGVALVKNENEESDQESIVESVKKDLVQDIQDESSDKEDEWEEGSDEDEDEDEESKEVVKTPQDKVLEGVVGEVEEEESSNTEVSEDNEENENDEIEERPPIQIKSVPVPTAPTVEEKPTKETTYKGSWVHKGVTYQRDGLDVFKNSDYIGEYDPTTDTINEDTVFMG